MLQQAVQSVAERRAYGKSLRQAVPRADHAIWSPGQRRTDPVALIEAQNEDRLQSLVPLRRARMLASPFAFYRATAVVMAADLAVGPSSGLSVQASGDAHLANFGFYASPERRLVFDLNDFDETLAGPWEWDVKRLAASFAIAARHNGIGGKKAQTIVRRSVSSYRKAMARLAEMRTTDVWYAHLREEHALDVAADEGQAKDIKQIARKARGRDSRQALDKLAEEANDNYRIRNDPPGLMPFRELPHGLSEEGLDAVVAQSFSDYQRSLADNVRRLLDRFTPVDEALKVVGVGSVGTVCTVMLLMGRDRHDPLFLQIKEAGRSVLEAHLPRSRYRNHGRRVVEGQRLMQTTSDIFLGWTHSKLSGRDYYWRQLRDWKGSADVEDASAADLRYQARLCGWTLARSHARSGDPVAIAGYLGSGDAFIDAVTLYAEAYADQNERDYEAYAGEVRVRGLEVAEEA